MRMWLATALVAILFAACNAKAAFPFKYYTEVQEQEDNRASYVNMEQFDETPNGANMEQIDENSCLTDLYILAFTAGYTEAGSEKAHQLEVAVNGVAKVIKLGKSYTKNTGDLWKFTFTGDLGFANCSVNLRSLDYIAFKSGNTDGWNISSVVTYVRSIDRSFTEFTRDIDVDRWIDSDYKGDLTTFRRFRLTRVCRDVMQIPILNTEYYTEVQNEEDNRAKFNYRIPSYVNMESFDETSNDASMEQSDETSNDASMEQVDDKSCLTHVYILAFTGGHREAGSDSAHKLKVTVNGINRSVKLSGLPGKNKGKLWKWDFHDLGFPNCVTLRNLDYIGFECGGKDGWMIDSVVTYVRSNDGSFREFTRDFDLIDTWLDSDFNGNKKCCRRVSLTKI